MGAPALVRRRSAAADRRREDAVRSGDIKSAGPVRIRRQPEDRGVEEPGVHRGPLIAAACAPEHTATTLAANIEHLRIIRVDDDGRGSAHDEVGDSFVDAVPRQPTVKAPEETFEFRRRIYDVAVAPDNG